MRPVSTDGGISETRKNAMAAGLIQLTDVNKTYKTGDETLKVLDRVCVTIDKGEFVAIIGPSGSGKSTLSNVIGGLDSIDSGDIIVDGIDISKSRDSVLSNYRNRKVGFVFQSFNLQGAQTTVENVAMPLIFGGVLYRKRTQRAEECLRLVGLGDRLGHKATQLSGGQRQRVAIARALVNQPSIVIADEPTGNLDTHRGAEIMTLLRTLNQEQGITLIMVTHDLDLAHQADRILTMQDGVLSENNSHSPTVATRTADRFRTGRNDHEPVIAEAGDNR
jgi:putative ABC transport system ATP-binding protein